MRIVALALTLLMAPALAQPAVDAKSGALFDAIAAQDTRLFDAYNSCDLKTLGAMVSSDLEFYHDQTGLARGRQALLDAIAANICHKVHRMLVPRSLEVYPLKHYGAVEIGNHVFCPADHPEKCNSRTSGTGRFIMVWQQVGTGWLLTRVISYDHVSDFARR